MVVYLTGSEKSRRQEIGRFAIHPNVAFRASGSTEPQRFLFSVADYPRVLEGSILHGEVAFDTSQGPARGARAQISVGFVNP
jgi:hypothetical protein